MKDKFSYYGHTIIDLYGASSGVVDLGDAGYIPRALEVQADLRTNTGYKVGLALSRASASVIGTNFAAAKAGLGYANQPGGGTITFTSDSASDTQVATVYGTVNGTKKVVCELLTLRGTTPTATTTSWGVVLGIELSSKAIGTITITKTSGGATIKTIAPAATASGVADVATASQKAYCLPVRVFQSATGTKTVGVVGTDILGRTVYDAITLTDAAITTAAGINGLVPFATVTKLLTADLASASTATFEVGNLTYASPSSTITNLGADGGAENAIVPLGYRYLHWCLANDVTAATGGVNDRLLIKLFGDHAGLT